MGTVSWLTPRLAKRAATPPVTRTVDAVCATGWGLLDADPTVSRHLAKAGQSLQERSLCGLSVHLMYAVESASARYGFMHAIPEALRRFREVVMADLSATDRPGGFDAVVTASHCCTRAIRAAKGSGETGRSGTGWSTVALPRVRTIANA
jgi:hypothetical protein